MAEMHSRNMWQYRTKTKYTRSVQLCLSDSKYEHSIIIIIIIIVVIDVCYVTDFWWGSLKERNTW